MGGQRLFRNGGTYILIHTAWYPGTKKSLMAQEAGRQPRRPGFDPRPFQARFVVNKVALGQVFLPALWFPPVSIIPLMLHVQPFIYYRRYIILAADPS